MKFFTCMLLMIFYYSVEAEAKEYNSKEQCWKDCWHGISGAGEVTCAADCKEYALANVPATKGECENHCDNGHYTPLVQVVCLDNCEELFAA